MLQNCSLGSGLSEQTIQLATWTLKSPKLVKVLTHSSIDIKTCKIILHWKRIKWL